MLSSFSPEKKQFSIAESFNSERINIPLTFFLVSSSAVLVVGLLNAFRMLACIRYKTNKNLVRVHT